MNTIRIQLFCAIVMVALIGSCIYVVCGKDRLPNVRNVAWNDFIAQIAAVLNESPQDSLGKEMLFVQEFLKSQETDESWNLRGRSVQGHRPGASSPPESRWGSGNAAKRLSYKEEQVKLRR
jgi:hypothetical protein